MKKLAALVTSAVLVAACQDTQIAGPTSSDAFDLPVPLTEFSAGGGCVAPPLGLVSWWPGDSDATDIIGVNHGTMRPNAGFTDGMVGQAFSFGRGGYMAVPDHASLDLTDELTVEFWFKYSVVPSTLQGLVAKRGSNTGDTPPTNYGVSFSASGFVLYYADNATESSRAFTGVLGLPAPMPVAGVFHHFASTYEQVDATNIELKIYIDGNLAGSAVKPGNLANTLNDDPLTIGASREYLTGSPGLPVGLETFDGIIDEVSIYNRALTGAAGEIGAIYNAGGAGKCRDGHHSGHEGVDFSAFEIDEAKYESDGEGGGEFKVEGMLLLGAESDDIDVLNEDVIVTFGAYSRTIPAGSFVRNGDDEGFEFNDGVWEVEIRDEGGFEVKGGYPDLSAIDLTNPVAFSLQIGNDIGQTTIQFDYEAKHELGDDDHNDNEGRGRWQQREPRGRIIR